VLRNLRWWDGETERRGDLRVRRGVVWETGRGLAPARRERDVDLDGFLALPGLVNAHDHLQLDLLPHLGRPPYESFYQWAREIYRPDESPVRDVLALPPADRHRWGGWRNVLAGATTVVHHDPYRRRWFGRDFPVRVLERFAWSHSLGYARDPVADFHRSGGPYVIHAAEGIDAEAGGEIDRLDALGLVGPRTVLVHAIAATPPQQRRLAESRTAVVWCPASNLRLYGRTAPIAGMKRDVAIALGTDSTLSGPAHLLDELRAARDTGFASPGELLRMVTTDAARVFGFDEARGRLGLGSPADILVVPDTGGSPADVLLDAALSGVALVAVRGRPRRASPAVAAALGLGDPQMLVDGARSWIEPDFSALRRRILGRIDEAVLDANPTWTMVRPAGQAA
jgi:cytosine/adenosine deaminase-related metal-dependent hydrolase